MAVSVYGSGLFSISAVTDTSGSIFWYSWDYDRKVVSDNASDTLSGNSLDDYLIGNGGNDTLVGGSGYDILQGSSNFTSTNNEIDILDGGRDGQNDIFVLGNRSGNLYRGTGYAVIQNYELGVDFIQFKEGSGGNGLGIIVERTQFIGTGGGTSATDTLIREASSGNLIGVIQDKAYTFNQLMLAGDLLAAF